MALTRRRFLAGAGAVVGTAAVLAGGCGPERRGQGVTRRVAVFREAFPGADWTAADRIAEALRQRGLTVVTVSAEGVADAAELQRHDALVLGDARFFPAAAIPALRAFLEPPAGTSAVGHLVAVGGPFLSELRYRLPGGWGDRAQILAAAVTRGVPLRLPAPSAWRPAGNTPSSAVALTESAGVWTFRIPDLQGWGNTNVAAGFAPGTTLMTFEARGMGDTRACIVEWDERDGSRWIATVRLGPDWKPMVLSPADFTFWPDPPVAGRGGPGDHLDPANAVQLSLGVDTAHCGAVSGAQAWSLRQVGTLAASAVPALAHMAVPRLAGLAPVPSDDADEAYVIGEPVRLRLEAGQRLVADLPQLPAVTGAVSPVYRPRGLGTPGSSPPLPYRFVPVVTARTAAGTLRGAPGAVIVHGGGASAGAVWVLLGLPSAMLKPAADYAARYVAQALETALTGPLLWNGGSPAIATPAGASLPLGATLVGPAGTAVSVGFRLGDRVVATATAAGGAPTSLYEATAVAPLGGGRAITRLAAEATAPSAPGVATLTVEVRARGRLVDALSYPLRVYGGETQRRQGPVTVAGGQFRAGGRPFLPVGVNYWPRSTSGLNVAAYGSGWLAPGLYDPEVVAADLAALATLGCNLVSGIQYTAVEQAPALRDFLARCDTHGIRADVYLRGGDPLRPDVTTLVSLIAAADLSADPAVFAYDLAWEPHVGGFAARTATLAASWGAWVADRYGSWARAQAAWGYGGDPRGPTDAQLTQSGPWAPMVAAYRRFLDDVVTEGYGQVWRAVRALGDQHLLGARTGYGGTGQMSVVAQMPLDLQSGMLYLDFASPEGYGLGPAYPDTLTGGLTTAYGRAVGGGKPVFWAEWGLSIWADPVGEQVVQGELYRSIWRMVAASGANGGTGWWFPGGLRVDEGSDYGVFNPDSTPRPAAQATAAAARGLGAPRPPDTWIAVDRDRYVQGYAGLWADWRDRYAALVNAGHLPGVRLPGSGSTSADCPLVALGGGPSPGYGPVQALNAAFVRVEVDGREIPNGAAVASPATASVTIGNTAPATWVDGVVLTVTGPDGNVDARIPLPATSVPYLGMVTFPAVPLPAGTGTATLRMAVRGRTEFGPGFHLRI